MTQNAFITPLQKYGLEHQLDILTEESAELIQAVSKLKRYHRRLDRTASKESELYAHLAEEIADVYLSIENILEAHQDLLPNIASNYLFKKDRLYDRMNQ